MPSLLIVEDDDSLAMSLEVDLKLEGYSVMVANDGKAAVHLALSQQFDLVVLDITLPGKDGFEVCRELRRSGRDMPIIMLTARSQDSDKVLGLELGADDYVTKPFNPRELRARIKAVLRRTGSELHDSYSFGEIEVDFGRHELRSRGNPVAITRTEFKLLTALIQHRGRVMTRDQLLENVWGLDNYVTDRTVDTHIANIRKKIEENPAHPRFLLTISGVGYRFDD